MTNSNQYEVGVLAAAARTAAASRIGPGMAKGPPAVMAGGPWMQGG